jgi:hypothetical protein
MENTTEIPPPPAPEPAPQKRTPHKPARRVKRSESFENRVRAMLDRMEERVLQRATEEAARKERLLKHSFPLLPATKRSPELRFIWSFPSGRKLKRQEAKIRANSESFKKRKDGKAPLILKSF